MRNFELEEFFAQWEFKARYHLTASDAQSMSKRDLLDKASFQDRQDYERLWLGYTETQGLPELRHEIAATYEQMNEDNVLCFCGAEEAIFVVMHQLLDKDDHAIIAVPNYQAMESIPKSRCEVSGIALRENDQWRLDPDELKSLIRPNTKLFGLNLPNNPTGALLPRQDLEELISLCREHGIYILCDEVYRGLEWDERRRLPQMADLYERGLSLNAMSKAYGLPGLRIGWLAGTDKNLLKRFNQMKHYLSICNSAPSEKLALIALKAKEAILERNRLIVRENLVWLDAFFQKNYERFEWQRPDGGCVAFPRYLGPEGASVFCRRLLEDCGVLLLPPEIYHSELLPVPTDRFRIGCGRINITEPLAVLQEFLDQRSS